jgi:hypothetical protein
MWPADASSAAADVKRPAVVNANVTAANLDFYCWLFLSSSSLHSIAQFLEFVEGRLDLRFG